MADGLEMEMELDEPQVPAVENEEFSVEVVNEGTEQDAEKLALEAKIAELEQQTVALTQAQPVDQTAALVEALSALRQPTPSPPLPESNAGAPQIDLKSLMVEANKEYFADPAQSTLKLVAPLLEQVQAQNKADSDSKSVKISMLTAMNDPGSKDIFTKYKDEIEATVAADASPDADVYQRAIGKVKSNHFDDILQEKAEALVAEALAKAQGTVAKTPPFSNATIPPAGGSVDARVISKAKVTAAQDKRIKQIALEKGLSYEKVYTYFKDKGQI